MSFRFLSVVAVGCLSFVASDCSRTSAIGHAVLRVCADPNNLPFSNDRLEGFENRLASLIASELDATIEYTWWAQRRGYIRNTIDAGVCDVWMGVPAGFERTLVTKPYYRSSYVFVTRHGGPHLATLDDPLLRRLRVGVQLVGDDGQNTPPAHALAARHIVDNVVGYTLYGDYSKPSPPAAIVAAVARGDVDVAVVWGPLAGYFARAQSIALDLARVEPAAGDSLPLAFSVAVGVARRLPALRVEIDHAIASRRGEIDRILDTYHVPRV